MLLHRGRLPVPCVEGPLRAFKNMGKKRRITPQCGYIMVSREGTCPEQPHPKRWECGIV